MSQELAERMFHCEWPNGLAPTLKAAEAQRKRKNKKVERSATLLERRVYCSNSSPCQVGAAIPDIKEQLHHIPKGYTAVEGVDDRTRHRLIGNGWHWGVARKLLTLVVAATMTPTGANMEITTPPKQSTLQWVVGQLPPGGIIMQPRPDRDHGPLVPYDLDEEQHWRAALALPHPAGHRPNIEPGWEQVLELATRWRHDLPRIRREVIQDIRQMVEDGTDELDKWLDERPPQVRATFTTPAWQSKPGAASQS